MKKTIKFLLAALLVGLMFSCEIVTLSNDITVYNNANYTIYDLYVIPDGVFVGPSYWYFDYDSQVESYCETYYSSYEQIGYGLHYSGSSWSVDLNSIDSFATSFDIIAIDSAGNAYYETIYSSDFSVTIDYYDRMDYLGYTHY